MRAMYLEETISEMVLLRMHAVPVFYRMYNDHWREDTSVRWINSLVFSLFFNELGGCPRIQ